MTHFDLFGLPKTFDVSGPALDKQFRELSLRTHPDRFVRASAKEKIFAAERSTALNEAYRVLRDPVRRAFYLVALSGLELDSAGNPPGQGVPAEFLEEMLALREELAQVREEKDLARAQRMAALVTVRQKGALESAAEELRKLEAAPADVAARDRAAHALAQLRYFDRFLEEVSTMEEEVAP